MFCPKCGEILRDSALRCPVCGASTRKAASQVNDPCDCGTNKRVTFQIKRPQTHSSGGSWSGKTYQHNSTQGVPGRRKRLNAGACKQLIRTFFKRSFDFGGRSSRREYWLTRLLLILGGLTAGILSDAFPVLATAWFLVIPVPYVALHLRRLHDTGRSGWWYLLKFVPIAGELILDIWFCLPSVPGNRWGPKPYV